MRVFKILVLTTKENDIIQELIVTQEGKMEIVEFPKGTLSSLMEPVV